MVPETPFKIAWIVWLLFFAVVEFIAVRREMPGDTFSEFVWWIIGTGDDQRDAVRWIARGVVLGVLLWLIPHFMTKWSWFK